MKQNKTKKIILTILVASFFLSGCGILSSSNNTNHAKVAREQSETIMEAVLNEDVDAIVELFCPYVKENHPELESEIQELFEFIDGEIVSYDDPIGQTGSGKSTAEKGIVKLGVSGRIENIQTTTGKIYSIGHGAYSVNDEHPDYVGVTGITVYDEEMRNPQVGYMEGGMYRIRYSEMFQ